MDSILTKLATKGITAEVVTTTRNGVQLTGCRINNGTSLAPVVYKNAEESDDEFVDKVIKVSTLPKPQFDVAKLSDPDYIKKNVIVTMQKQSTEDLCKRDFLDLEGVIRVVIADDNHESIGSVKITRQLQETLGLSDDELFEHALANMRERFQVKTLSEVIGLPADMIGPCPFYVCSTDRQTAGASALMMPEVFKAFCDKKGLEECTILPSSTEELLILAGRNEDAAALAAMVSEVNDTVVDRVMQLNPTVYVYNTKTGVVSIAATF